MGGLGGGERRILITGNVHKVGIHSAEQSDIITESNIDFHESFLRLSSRIKASRIPRNALAYGESQLDLMGTLAFQWRARTNAF